jgi:hypothetical protein
MRRDRTGKFAKSQWKKVLEFEALLLGSVAVVGLLIYFWTPIAINALGNQLANVYTKGF